MFWFKYVQGLLRTLNADVSPNEIAAGVVMGAAIGLMPKTNLLVLVLWCLVLIFRVNFGMATASIIIFALLGHLTDPLAERMGFWALTDVSALHNVWVFLYNRPFIPFTAFNNTLVLGNLILALLIAPFLFLAARHGVVVYRERYRAIVLDWKIMKVFNAGSYLDFWNRWRNR